MRSLTREEELAVRPEMTETFEVAVSHCCYDDSEKYTLNTNVPTTVWDWSLNRDTRHLLGLTTPKWYVGQDQVTLSTRLNRFGCRYMRWPSGVTLSVLPESETSERKLELRIPDTLFNYGLEKETENA